jgi:O-antigen ligase
VKTLRRVGAHNQYVEFTYKAGLPVGAAWLFILVAMFIMIVIGLVKRKGDWIYFVMLNYPTFFWFSLLETGVFPMERGFILIYYLSLLPLLIRQAQAKDTIEKTIEETTEENKSMVEEM